jgi:uncharacterized protein YybS (DUF2232 family)
VAILEHLPALATASSFHFGQFILWLYLIVFCLFLWVGFPQDMKNYFVDLLCEKKKQSLETQGLGKAVTRNGKM